MPKKNPKSATARNADRSATARSKTEITLAKEVKDLTKEVKKLKEMEFIKVLKYPWKYMGLSFLHGLMVGFGWVIGASVLVALLIYLLAQIQFVPYIGGFVTDVIEEVQSIKPLVEENINKKTETLDTQKSAQNDAPTDTLETSNASK